MRELDFATGNQHKVDEANLILSEFGIKVKLSRVPKVEIQSDSLEEIAEFAAQTAFKKTGAPVVVEDSGLFIDFLNGFPGPYSSYAYRTIGCSGILRLLAGAAERSARFECVVVYADEGTLRSFRGTSRGEISETPRGVGGFGFDPIFVCEGCGGRTFSQLLPREKCAVSHRGRAFRALGEWLGNAVGYHTLK
ncbi:MAG: XTP/dITP diphosphatase [Candidatus Verstraetearchaeota archaeon]|nr:XTP/dITP diphosphatase [Candidatus Verstraetearchaeota archaeon]